MKTVDFLSTGAFEAFLERRRSPRRIAIVAAYGLVVAGLTAVVRWESGRQEQAALLSEAPNAVETRASQDLRETYAQMNAMADRLDPLAAHLRLPAAGSLFANIGTAAGEFVRIEEIGFEQMVGRKGEKIEYAELHMKIKALVHGDQNLIQLPERLRAYAGVKHASTDSSELVLEMRDTMRTEVHLVGELLLPGMTDAKIRPESIR
jgi:hypothetical protein